MKKLKELSDEESGDYDSDYKIESRKRVIKLKSKKEKLIEKTAKPPKSKFLELEADEGSASDEEEGEFDFPRAARGNIYSLITFISFFRMRDLLC